MQPLELAVLAAGGVVAGVINTLAGGGSMLTVPLLVVLGLPGTLANGTNRLGILVQNLSATWSFRRDGIDVARRSVGVLLPVAAGSVVGAVAISRVADETFERVFGLVMLAVLAPTLRAPKPDPGRPGVEAWSPAVRTAVFFAIGAYGGSFQAGVGIALLLALSRAGFDLVTANAVKVIVIAAITLVALPVFVLQGQIVWLPAGVLAIGFGIGGAAGARLATRGGERLIRPVLAIAVVALAARMLGLV